MVGAKRAHGGKRLPNGRFDLKLDDEVKAKHGASVYCDVLLDVGACMWPIYARPGNIQYTREGPSMCTVYVFFGLHLFLTLGVLSSVNHSSPSSRKYNNAYSNETNSKEGDLLSGLVAECSPWDWSVQSGLISGWVIPKTVIIKQNNNNNNIARHSVFRVWTEDRTKIWVSWMLLCPGPELSLKGNHLKVSDTVNTDLTDVLPNVSGTVKRNSLFIIHK